MPKKFECIASVNVGAGGASTISFSSIPSTYTDLMILLSLRKDTSYDRRLLQMEINGLTSGYNDLSVYGYTASVSHGVDMGGNQAVGIWDLPAALATANTFSNIYVYIPNYTSGNPKSIIANGNGENASNASIIGLSGGLSSTTSAITSLNFFTGQGGNFVQYSTVTLYGISKS